MIKTKHVFVPYFLLFISGLIMFALFVLAYPLDPQLHKRHHHLLNEALLNEHIEEELSYIAVDTVMPPKVF